MKLNPDCIRDILITVENHTGYYEPMTYNENTKYEELSKYSHEEIMYHFLQCSKAKLIDGTNISLDEIDVGDLSPTGHEFLANTGSKKVWKDVKKIAAKIGVTSLSALVQIASNVTVQLIKGHFGF